ncbi:MAG TPA: EamA family transporter [Actinomycetota bacterium]|nr:EamA family transporter [Actinomycetota bacterium]
MGRSGLSAKAWLALLAVYIIWGSTYLAIRVAVRTVPPLLAAGGRWTLAGILMMTFGLRARNATSGESGWPTARQWRSAAIIGTALCLGGNGLVSVAEKRISSGMAALLIAIVPLFVALFDFVRNRTRMPASVIGGLALGFGGTAILVRPQHGAGAVDTVGALTVIAAAAAWAAGSLYARTASLPERPAVATGMEMLCGGIASLIVAAIGGDFNSFHPGAVSGRSLLAIAYLVVFGSLVAFSAYVWLLRNIRISIVTTYAYVNPLVAVLLGWLILNERVTSTVFIGGSIIIVAVAIIVASRGEPPLPKDANRADLAMEELPS